MRRVLVAALLLVMACGCGSGPGATKERPVATVTSVDVEPPGPFAPPESAAATAPAPASTAPGALAGPGPAPAPAPPPTPTALGAELARVERALRDPATPGGDLPVLGRAQQADYRQLAAHPGWQAEVLRLVPPPLHAAVVANARAEARLASMHVRKPTNLPAWRIVAPPPADVVVAAQQTAANEIGVPWEILAAIHLVETRMGRIRGTSTAGARGPMQLLPSTWAQYGAGGEIEDLTAASKAAARLLTRNGVNGDSRAAVWSYNHSAAYVDAVLSYAATMRSDPRAFLGYHAWQVVYRLASGDLLLPEGWPTTPATPAP